MNTHTSKKRQNGSALRSLLLAILSVTLACTLGCSKPPPDDIVKEAVTADVKTQAVRSNPFTASADLGTYKITNTYKSGDATVYEYQASILLTVHSGQTLPTVVSGKIAFQKQGDRWAYGSVN